MLLVQVAHNHHSRCCKNKFEAKELSKCQHTGNRMQFPCVCLSLWPPLPFPALAAVTCQGCWSEGGRTLWLLLGCSLSTSKVIRSPVTTLETHSQQKMMSREGHSSHRGTCQKKWQGKQYEKLENQQSTWAWSYGMREKTSLVLSPEWQPIVCHFPYIWANYSTSLTFQFLLL